MAHRRGLFLYRHLLQRHENDLLMRHIDLLRNVVRSVQTCRPFHIHGWVVLPEHLHCVIEFPPDNADCRAHMDYVHYNPAQYSLIRLGVSRGGLAGFDVLCAGEEPGLSAGLGWRADASLDYDE